jgi:hypothetical protein
VHLDVDLFAFGNAAEVRGPRPRDFGLTADEDLVGPFAPAAPSDEIPGCSTFVDPARAQLTGYCFVLPVGTPLPAGLAVRADGEDCGGLAPWGHRTIYPTLPMSFGEFRALVRELPWRRVGRMNANV